MTQTAKRKAARPRQPGPRGDGGQPDLLGWDAVCAMNAVQISAVFRQQYLAEGPTSPVRPIRVAFPDGDDLMVVDTVLGPPNFSFSDDGDEPQCELSMFLVTGRVLRVDPAAGVVRNVLPLEPRSSWLNGPVTLTGMQGTVDDSLGRVGIDLGAAAFQPVIGGIDPESEVLTEMSTALQTYFRTQSTSYPLGEIQKGPDGLSGCLAPSEFDFVVQQNPDLPGDGAVLLLIRTTGSGGTVGPLSPYPLPEGDTAALLVSGDLLFTSLIAPTLTQEFKNIGTTFTAEQQSDGSYRINGSGGTLDLGGFPNPWPGQPDIPYTSNDSADYDDVTLQPATFTLVSDGTDLVSTFTCSFEQYFSMALNPPAPPNGDPAEEVGKIVPGFSVNHCDLDGTVTTSYTANADPTTGIVSFVGQTKCTLTPDNTGSGWSSFWSGTTDFLPDDIQSSLGSALQSVLQQVTLPDVGTFALQNLLFPSEQVLQLTAVAVPGDLTLTGQVESVLTVSPPTVTLTPTGQQQFGATVAGSTTAVDWEVQPPLGAIDPTGLYQAPDSVHQPGVVIVTAIDQADGSRVGRAMVLLAPAPPSSDRIVTPTALTLTAGQGYDFVVVDSDGNPVDGAVCTLSPSGVGTLEQGWGAGQWIYTAPDSVTQSQTVTISPGPSGVAATVQLATTTTVTVTASSTTVSAGGTVTLTAASDDLDRFTWCVYPTGMGTVAFTEGTTTAVYTAPATVQDDQSVTLLAWGSDNAVGCGWCRLTLTSS
ncbi:hypothetical protein [Streptomyces sp. NPDC051132]|uniref:hypothetical protein n=1 Tax=unclassified Streptomyces TaxID=2593676 RepID=UPI00342E51F9